MIIACSFKLNMGDQDGPHCWIQVMVDVPDDNLPENLLDDAQEIAKSCLRPFLNNSAWFGEFEPMVVGVNREGQ